MSEIRRWVTVDRANNEMGEYDSYREAEQDARKYDLAIVEHVYEFSDSELVWTPNGEDTWPPEGGEL